MRRSHTSNPDLGYKFTNDDQEQRPGCHGNYKSRQLPGLVSSYIDDPTVEDRNGLIFTCEARTGAQSSCEFGLDGLTTLNVERKQRPLSCTPEILADKE